MGTTMQHAAAIVVPLSTGFILNFVGYQVPFAIACGFAFLNIFVVQKLDPTNQRSAGRRALDERAAVAQALEAEAVEAAGDAEPGSRLSSTAAAVAIAERRSAESDE
jgi:hypothetical protein